MAFTAITIEGGLFPGDLLERLASGIETTGQRQEDFGFKAGHRLSDEMQAAFSDVRSYWDAFQRRRQKSRESLTTLTRDFWVIPLLEDLGFKMEFQRRAVTAGSGGETYAFSHRAGDDPEAPPVHIIALDQALDRKGEGRRSPHALVQEYLNRSDSLWGLVTNGKNLRLLRDTARLARPTFAEFDLEAMVEGNLYSEFVLLYRLLHRSRFPVGAADAPECWLEKYYQQGIEEGGRVREHLREGVEVALQELGTAFLAHPDSHGLRQAIQEGKLSTYEYYRQLLRLVYRLLFLMVAEERRLLFPPEREDLVRQAIYTHYYSISGLRERCERRLRDDPYADLWIGLRETFRLFQNDDRAGRLGLAALDGELFSSRACPDLEGAGCENGRLLLALYQLSTFSDGRVRRRVNYAGLDVEELGSIYESLLEYHPVVRLDPPGFELAWGSERRQTGSYYTPPDLVREIIDHALVPVMEERLSGVKTKEEKEAVLRRLKVCDPASGSGHFLLAAGRRLGRELAKVRTGEEEPSPEAYREAVRDIIRECLYAVDKNPLAVDLCKVALWLEGHCAGLPLSFLDHHVKCGDSLVGIRDLAWLQEGIPDAAYQPVGGNDRGTASILRRQNREERERQSHLFRHQVAEQVAQGPQAFTPDFQTLMGLDDRTPQDVQAKEELYDSLRHGPTWWRLKVACDLWTAPFFIRFEPPESGRAHLVPTSEMVWRYFSQGSSNSQMEAQGLVASEIYRFFHWPLEFPEVFEVGGFDVILGNPPFMGGSKISDKIGHHFRKFISFIFAPASGIADLCAYFYRLAFNLLSAGGHIGMVATNSIGQGDTRESGLAIIVENGGTITFAKRFLKWPGAANVEVNILSLCKGKWNLPHVLDGKKVDYISSRLDEEQEAQPNNLFANHQKVFRGSTIRGNGFLITSEEVENLLANSYKNRDCLFPFLNGEDFNFRPDQSPSRWVICFFDWPIEKCLNYPDLLKIVEEKVRPEREKINQSREREYWWLFERFRVDLHKTIESLNRVMVRALTSELHMLAFAPKGLVYSQAVIVFAFDDYYHFALLQSNLHEAWVRRYASTMRTDIRYTPTDCFENFPFPQDAAPEHRDWSARVGERYHEHRREVMLARNLGLTKTYNLFHNPELQDHDIRTMRELHAEMDRAILACYGWQEVDLGHGFHVNERGQTRYTISPPARREILARLLKLNLELATAETADPTLTQTRRRSRRQRRDVIQIDSD